MSDGVRRAERVLNLLALLLDTATPVSRHEIVEQVDGYPRGGGETARRAFERDKEMLRSMGVPLKVTVGSDGAEQLYNIRPDEYYLPDLALSEEEAAALRIAVTAVALGSGAGEGALLKLGAFGGNSTPPIAALPMVPQLAPLFDAFRRRCVVTFTYRGERRTVEPWALISRRGRWYVVGHDRARAALRTFRADRIADDVQIGQPDAFDVDDDFEPGTIGGEEPWQYGDEQLKVQVAIDATHLDEFLAAVGPDVPVESGPVGAAVVTLDVANRVALRTFLLGFEEHVEVIEPPEVRTEMVSWLERVAGHGSDDR